MEFEDKILRCVDCGEEFAWTAGEQSFFDANKLAHEPKHCRTCKAKRASRRVGPSRPRQRVESQATCSACGRETTVPFLPSQGRPVFCRECFQRRRVSRAGGRPLA